MSSRPAWCCVSDEPGRPGEISASLFFFGRGFGLGSGRRVPVRCDQIRVPEFGVVPDQPMSCELQALARAYQDVSRRIGAERIVVVTFASFCHGSYGPG